MIQKVSVAQDTNQYPKRHKHSHLHRANAPALQDTNRHSHLHKAIIFDASTIITLAMNGFLPELRKLREIFDGKFLVTEEVRKEIIDKPMQIKRFEFEALKVNELLKDKVLEMPVFLNIEKSLISKKAQEFVDVANNFFEAKGEYLHLIDLGEASCLALSRILDEKGIKNVVAVDERTTRMLGEKPENLENLLRRKLHARVKFMKKNFKFFEGFKFIRSAELMYVAYKKKFITLENNALEALLYALKFKGAAISGEEIKEIVRLNSKS